MTEAEKRRKQKEQARQEAIKHQGHTACADSPMADETTLDRLTDALAGAGFVKESYGQARKHGNKWQTLDDDWAVYTRIRPLVDAVAHDSGVSPEKGVPKVSQFGVLCQKYTETLSEKPHNNAVSSDGVNATMGGKSVLTPSTHFSSGIQRSPTGGGPSTVHGHGNQAPEAASGSGALPDGGKLKPSDSIALAIASGSQNLPTLSDFATYPSLANLQTGKPAICIGFDSEWQTYTKPDGSQGRQILSWQFSVVWDECLYEFLFFARSDKNLLLDNALAFILDTLDIMHAVDGDSVTRYMYCYDFENGEPVVKVTSDFNEAIHHARYIYVPDAHRPDGTPIALPEKRFLPRLIKDMPDRDAVRSARCWGYFHRFYDFKDYGHIPVFLVCHAGKVDMSSLNTRYRQYIDLDGTVQASFDYVLRSLTDIQGGTISLKRLLFVCKSTLHGKTSRDWLYPCFLNVRDTLAQAPAGRKRLEDLGMVLGVHKLDLPEGQKSDMIGLLRDNPVLYADYACQDSTVTVLYAAGIYGYNRSFPVTGTSAGARVMKAAIASYLGTTGQADFELIYRGLAHVEKGLVHIPDRSAFLRCSNLEPISDKANTVQFYASHAYHGGYNSCSSVGYFPEWSWDYDLQNAYPTAMCMVPDIDWCNPVKVTIENRELRLSDWLVGGHTFNPFIPMVAYVKFEFPKDVAFPCIPVVVKGVPIFPRCSRGAGPGGGDYVYACGPELYLAVKLGAKVYCETGYVLTPLLREDENGDMQESRSLSYAVHNLVSDRALAKADHGKGSLEELFLKLLVNSGYGKVAQNVVPKSSWDAFTDSMAALGASPITNPVSACLITSIVRAELLAAENQIVQAGYKAVSVTTDGFISTAPVDFLKSLDLYGMRPWLVQVRLFLTDGKDPELWEPKHKQDDLINFTTRGNVSLRCPERDGFAGVCAHNSTKSGFTSDSYEDRLWLMTHVLGRTGTVDWVNQKWTGYKELVHGWDFTINPETKHITMDYDMKRKPIPSSVHDTHPVVEGTEYTIANVETEPYDDVAEFLKYRQKKEQFIKTRQNGKTVVVGCLRTKADWDKFFTKVNGKTAHGKVVDTEWLKLWSLIAYYRRGEVQIPPLDGLTVDEKISYINKHNWTGREFTKTDWKNVRRPERQKHLLPIEQTFDFGASLLYGILPNGVTIYGEDQK